MEPSQSWRSVLGVMVTGIIMVLLFEVAVGPRVDVPSGIYTSVGRDFRKLIDRRIEQPSLIRMSLFTAISSSAERGPFAEWCRGQRSFRTPSEAGEHPVFVAGPATAVAAVRMDAFPLEASRVPDLDGFSAECWFRWHGMGSRPSANIANTGSVMTFGDGVGHGWGLTLNCVTGHLNFNIGRDKPQGSASITSVSRIPPHVWAHVTVVRDGDTIRCYVNGLLSAVGRGVGVSGTAPPWAQLRLGYVGNGLGSVVCDYAGAAMYDRPLSDAEVFRLNYPAAAEQWSHSLLQARSLLTAGRPSEAIAELQKYPELTSLPYQWTRLEALLEQGDHEEAAVVASNLIRMSDQRSRESPQPALDFTAAAARLLLRAVENGIRFESTSEQRMSGLINAVHIELSSAATAGLQEANSQFVTEQRQLWGDKLAALFRNGLQPRLLQVCGDCHEHENWIADAQFIFGEQHDVQEQTAEQRAKLIEVLAAETMPPAGSIPLGESVRVSMLQLLRDLPKLQSCGDLTVSDRSFRQRRRLTRTEFGNSLFDLLGVRPGDDLLPPRDGGGGEGFDTASGTLTISLSTAEQMHTCITTVVNTAVGRGESPAVQQIVEELRADHQSELPSLLRFAESAWCRQLSSDDQHLLRSFAITLRDDGVSTTEAAETLVSLVLMSGDFLFPRIRCDEDDFADSSRSYVLARQLALFLWSSHPDAQLLERAADHSLLDSEVIGEEVQRMLADSRSLALGDSFGEQWLGIREFAGDSGPQEFFPEFTQPVREAMREQAGRFIVSLLTTERPLDDLLHTRQHWLNAELADYYGLQHHGRGWLEASLPDNYPGGVVGLGAVLTSTSYPARTSPVLRGRWVLDRLLGVRVQPPPPDVPPLQAEHSAADMKSLMARHREGAACRGCHALMDPVGLTLEGFDPVGRRRRGNGSEISTQAAGELPDGRILVDVAGLEDWLNSQSQAVFRQFARKLLGYATGRRMSVEELCEVDRILDSFDPREMSGAMLVQKLVLSRAFLGWSVDAAGGEFR